MVIEVNVSRTRNGALTTGVAEPLLATNVTPSRGKASERSVNVAMPAAAVTVAVPNRVSGTEPAGKARVTEAFETAFPKRS
jgi:hypothetical protein